MADKRSIDLSRIGPLKYARVSGNEEVEKLEYAAWDLLDICQTRPSKASEIPPIAKWLKDNEEPLDLLVQAASRPEWYSPPPKLIAEEDKHLFVQMIPEVQEIRSAIYSLLARAMANAHGGNYGKAWEDIHASLLLSRHVSRGPTLVDHMTGSACQGLAANATVALLEAGADEEAIAMRILRDLQALPPIDPLADKFSWGERLMWLDAIVRIANGSSAKFLDDEETFQKLTDAGVDWNLVLREANHWFDRMENAGRLANVAERIEVSAQIESDFEDEYGDRPNVENVNVDIESRSQAAADILLSLLVPPCSVVYQSEARAIARWRLLTTSAVLAVFHARHGNYPNSLDELVPDLVAEIPNDPYCDQPLIYRRTDDGYLLHARGPNGVDDGGNHKLWEVVSGYQIDNANKRAVSVLLTEGRVEELDRLIRQIPEDADDIAIRLPLPKVDIAEIVEGR